MWGVDLMGLVDVKPRGYESLPLFHVLLNIVETHMLDLA